MGQGQHRAADVEPHRCVDWHGARRSDGYRPGTVNPKAANVIELIDGAEVDVGIRIAAPRRVGRRQGLDLLDRKDPGPRRRVGPPALAHHAVIVADNLSQRSSTAIVRAGHGVGPARDGCECKDDHAQVTKKMITPSRPRKIRVQMVSRAFIIREAYQGEGEGGEALHVDHRSRASYGGQVKELRRRLAGVTPQDTSTSGRPRLWAWGYGYMADLAGISREQVREAVKAGLDASDPIEVLCWALERRGQPKLAAKVRAVLHAKES